MKAFRLWRYRFGRRRTHQRIKRFFPETLTVGQSGAGKIQQLWLKSNFTKIPTRTAEISPILRTGQTYDRSTVEFDFRINDRFWFLNIQDLVHSIFLGDGIKWEYQSNPDLLPRPLGCKSFFFVNRITTKNLVVKVNVKVGCREPFATSRFYELFTVFLMNSRIEP